jgi:DNA-binding MarR family transcriptional regulator
LKLSPIERAAAVRTVEVALIENQRAVVEPSAELAELFRRTAGRLHRGTREALAPLGLSGSQARLVRLLADGPLRMSVIAERLSVVARTVTDVVDGAEVAGVVARRADEEDRRSIFVELTPAGRRLLDRLDAARSQSAARVFGVLTEPQRDQLLVLLNAICAADEHRAEPRGAPAAPAAPSVAAHTASTPAPAAAPTAAASSVGRSASGAAR